MSRGLRRRVLQRERDGAFRWDMGVLYMKDLTERQAEVLEFIRRTISRLGRSPSIREICEHMSISSKNGAHEHVSALVRKGYVVRDSGSYYGLRLVDERVCHICQRHF